MDRRLTDRRVQWPADRADAPRDLSALPTHRLLSGGPGPALQPPEVSALTKPVEPDARGSPPAAAVAGTPLRPPRKGEPRLHGADTCEQEAVKLQATAQVLERLARACSVQLEQARERYQQLQTLVGATGATTYDLEHARLDMESYATTMLQMREEHLAFLRRAEQYRAAAALLRGEERQGPEERE